MTVTDSQALAVWMGIVGALLLFLAWMMWR